MRSALEQQGRPANHGRGEALSRRTAGAERLCPGPGPFTPSRGHSREGPGVGGGLSRSRSALLGSPVSAPLPSGLGVDSRRGTQSNGLVSVKLAGGALPPAAALAEPAPPRPASPRLVSSRLACRSPSGVIFFRGDGGGGTGPTVDARKVAGSVSAAVLSEARPWGSRGRKRFLQEGARRSALSSPCTGGTQKPGARALRPPFVPAWEGR